MFAIGGVTAVFLVFKWHEWSAAMKLCAVNAAILPFHVLEEWILPGGFHYAYNMNQKVFDEKLLHQYPTSKLTDMITNFPGELVFTAFVFFHAGQAIAFGVMIFDIMEFFAHTMLGVKMYRYYKDKGKKSIYAPGTLTAYFMQLPSGIAMIIWYIKNGIDVTDVLIGMFVVIAAVAGTIIIPEKVFSSEDSSYGFKDAGYFKKFGAE